MVEEKERRRLNEGYIGGSVTKGQGKESDTHQKEQRTRRQRKCDYCH